MDFPPPLNALSQEDKEAVASRIRPVRFAAGERIFGAEGVRTQFPYPPTEHQRQWAVNAYANGLRPNPHTLVIDDAAISTMRLR